MPRSHLSIAVLLAVAGFVLLLFWLAGTVPSGPDKPRSGDSANPYERDSAHGTSAQDAKSPVSPCPQPPPSNDEGKGDKKPTSPNTEYPVLGGASCSETMSGLTEVALDLAGAERSLLDDDLRRNPRMLRVAKAKYRREYSRIIEPDYSFLTTEDSHERGQMRLHAIVRCIDPKCASVLLGWVRRSEDREFRRVALTTFGMLPHMGREEDRRRMLRVFLAHLEEDMPLERFAESLGRLREFAKLPLPDGVLSAWNARAQGDSPAAEFVRRIVQSVASNNSVVPSGLDLYPRIKIKGESFEPEGAMK